MTEPLAFTLWLLLAVIQQHGSVGLSFGTQAACLEARVKLRTQEDTVALAPCVPIELVQVLREPRRAPPQDQLSAPDTPTPVPP